MSPLEILDRLRPAFTCFDLTDSHSTTWIATNDN